MKIALWIVGGIFALLVGVVLIVPNVIDWNSYKPQIADKVEALTGRQLIIAGDIDMKIFPAPALTAEKVSLGSIDGAQSPDLIALRSAEVRIAMAPLLGGNIVVETVRLIEPQVFLEVLADGRRSWDFAPPKGDAAAAAVNGGTGNGGASAGGGPNITLNQFEIVDGTLSYSDAASGSSEKIQDMDLTIAAASLAAGPYKANGSLIAKGMRLGLSLNVGTIVEGRTFPLDAAVRVGGDSAEMKLAGTVLGLGDAPRFRGDLNLASPNLGSVVAALADGAALPAPLSQPFSLTGTLDASASSLKVENLKIGIGGAEGTGSITGNFAENPRITAEFKIDKIDADPWLTSARPASPAPADRAAAADKPAPASSAAAKDTAPFALPTGIAVTLGAEVGEITLKGDKIRNVIVNAELANGELTLSQASLQGPGESDFAAFGFLNAKDGKPFFDLSIESKVRAPGTLLKWAEVDTSALKPGKPGSLALNGRLSGSPETISVQDLLLSFDKTVVRGAATVALRDRLGFGASVAVNELDIDAYLADAKPGTAPPAKPAEKPAAGGGETKPAATPAAGPIDGLQGLTGFDANIRASVGTLKTQGIPLKGVEADLSLIAGDLTIRKLAVADVGSVQASLSGILKGLRGVPTAEKMALRATIADPVEAAKIAGIDLPDAAKKIGKTTFSADANGPLDGPAVVATLDTLAAKINAEGTVRPFDAANLLDIAFSIRHADTAVLLRRLGANYTPSGNIGGLDLSTRLKGGLDNLAISKLVAAVGAAKVEGDGTLSLAGERPKITANLTTGPITVDPFLPAGKSAQRAPDDRARVIPARFVVRPDGRSDLLQMIAADPARWSPAPIDLSGLRIADLDLTLTSPSIKYHEYNLLGARLVGDIKDGVMKISTFTGRVFDGSFAATAQVDASKPRAGLSSSVNLAGMDIGAASAAAGIASSSGKLTSRIDVTSVGVSVADWIAALDGAGAVEVRGVKGKTSLADVPIIGIALGPLFQVFEILNSGLGALIGAGANTGIGETDVTSTFTIKSGILNTKDTKIISNIYNGSMAGDIDLPQWKMNVGGEIAVDQGLIGSLLANVVRLPSKIPFQLTGNIDKPDVKLQSLSSTGQPQGVQIPGLDKLEKKAPGVGGLIQGILGGGSAAPAPSTETAPPAQGSGTTEPPAEQPPAQQPPAPQQQEDPINRLLRGLAR